MKLTAVHVTNFRSVEDSTEFEVGQSLCLVGKNEAGKSAILQALTGLNPHPSTLLTYDLERDYPRRHLTEYEARHGGKAAIVVKTKWSLSKSERQSLETEFGAGTIKDAPVIITRAYGEGPSFDPPIDYAIGVKNLIKKIGLSAAESEPFDTAQTSHDLRNALQKIESRTEKQEKLLQTLEALPGKNLRGAVTAQIEPLLPQFMYFSHYDRMDGQVRIDTYAARKSNGNPQITTGERVFVDFLEYAGTSIEEINAQGTYEALNARCEAASARITDQLKEYWTQNPFLEIEVRVTKAEPNDPAPFNTGVIGRARVKNNLHRLTLPFSERSAGFIWFFSFLVKFSQVRKQSPKGLILLLDEPGLTLHGKAQADLLRYFSDKLEPNHQVIFSTHSPFMVPSDKFEQVKIAEDKVETKRPGVWTSAGTKVRSDVLAVDRDTLFPLQGALGYEITQSLFVGKHTLLVEGPSDILFLQAFSAALGKRNRTQIDPRWTVCPSGSLDKIQPFVALFAGANLDVAALTDYAKGDKRKIESLKQNQILQGGRLLTYALLLELEEADVEDIFHPNLYTHIVNQALAVDNAHKLTPAKVLAADSSTRLVKKMEAACRLLPEGIPEFNHFLPSEWLIRNPDVLDGDKREVLETLDRAEVVLKAINALLN